MRTIVSVAAFSIGLLSSINSTTAAPTVTSYEAPAVTGVVLTDNRSEERKKHYRSSVLSPMAVLGDDAIKPSGIVRLQQALVDHKKQSAPIKLVVNDFAIIDYFPKRLAGAANAGGVVTNEIVRDMIDSRTDWKLVNQLSLPPKGEAVICLFSGEIDGKRVVAATFSEYKPSALTLSLHTSKPFLTAIDAAINQAVIDALAK